LTGAQTALKRTFDIIVAGAVFVVAAPLLAVLAVAIKTTSRGPVFFRQLRVTKGGHLFRMFKFRTMLDDADRIIEEKGIDTSVPFFKLGPEDPRLTTVGRFLRKYSLDELPQLLNVLRGDMSLVGPRPLPADQVAANLDLLGPRHEVPAGVTGWWQIQGRSEVEDPDEAVRMDLFYIENWSLTLDLYVLLKTFGVVLRKKGAF
jgi:lipopolysaccharide/colanic/teichoic acid biosynthesis glycosyltransferase